MKSLQSIVISFLTLVLLSSCGEDDYTYPDVITSYACLHTDNQGRGVLLKTDNGCAWHIDSQYQPAGLTKDSVFRVVSQFDRMPQTQAADSIIRVYSLRMTISPLPVPRKAVKEMHTDPVSIQSIWKSEGYLNLILEIRKKNKMHMFGFVEDTILKSTTGTNKLMLTFFHDRKGDTEAFDEKAYFSVPLQPYEEMLHTGDSIIFRLQTYKEGMTERTFIY